MSIINLRTWHIINLDTFQKISGPYEPVQATESPGPPVYAEHTALGRSKPVKQFLHGTGDSVTLSLMLHADHALKDMRDELNTLKVWRLRDQFTGHPPILAFWMGKGDISLDSCVIENISDIVWERLDILGRVRGCTFSITLSGFTEYDISAVPPHETRYHHVKTGEYYELLAYREYRNAALGDFVRRRHPDKPSVVEGEIVTLPSVDALRKLPTRPHSGPFVGSYKSGTPEAVLRELMFDERNVSYVSHVI